MRAIVYNTDTGEIVRQMTGDVPLEKQVLENSQELLTEDETDIPEGLSGKMVDTSTSPPTVVDDPNFSPPVPTEVDRSMVSDESKQAFRDARANSDVQTQLDILFHILTGEQP